MSETGPEELQDRLRAADEALRSVMAERDEAVQQAADLHTRWQATDVQLRHLRIAYENAGHERDDLVLRLVTLEQRLAGAPRGGLTAHIADLVEAQREVTRLRAKNRELRARIRGARAELHAARAALAAAGTTLPRRVVRRLRARGSDLS